MPLPACEAPRPLPLRPQPLLDSAAGKRRQLAEPTHPEPFELGVPVRRERQQRERERLQEALLLLPLDDHCLPGTGHARRREGDEATPTRACARVPGRSDGGERLRERRLHPSVEPLDAAGLERDEARLGRLDCEARILQAAQHPLPLLLDRGRILLDQHEVGAGGERLPHPHPHLHPGSLGSRRDRPDERLLARLRGERRRHERQPRPGAQRGPQRESRDEEAGDH